VREERRVRPHEMLLAAYFAVTGMMIVLRGLPELSWVPLLLLHLGTVALILLVLPQLTTGGWRGALRSWLPIAALPLIYKEVGVLNTLFVQGYHDTAIQSLELSIFGTQAAVAFREAAPWKPLSEYLHFGYFGYYALFPLLGGTLYLRGRQADYDRALTITIGTFLVCYLIFIVYPVAGPWYHFARPAAGDLGWVFPGLIHAVLERGAAEGAAFPSSHAAAAVAIWLAAWKLERKVFWVLSAIVPSLVLGTVYGGFHYAVDALAGVLTGIVCYVMFSRVYLRLAGMRTAARERDPGRSHEREQLRVEARR
jgi:membrane-associated phospholipid phosphatase